MKYVQGGQAGGGREDVRVQRGAGPRGAAQAGARAQGWQQVDQSGEHRDGGSHNQDTWNLMSFRSNWTLGL